MLDHAIFTKSDHWEYEQEWRIIQFKRGAGVYRMPPEALVGVILGAQIGYDDKRDVLEWVNSRSHHTKIYQAKVSKTTFELQIEEATNT